MPNFIFAQRGGKKLVVQRVLNQINEEGRRFLKQIRAGTVRNWEEVNHEIAFEKVAQVSRDCPIGHHGAQTVTVVMFKRCKVVTKRVFSP